MDIIVALAENQYLETERLKLRPVRLEDVDALFEYASDLENTAHVFPAHPTTDETRKVIARFYMAAPLGKYGIILKEEDKLIGTIDIRVEEHDKKAELGYAMNQKYSGQGYMTEAGNKILEFAFQEMKLNQIYARHSTINPKSGKVMQRLGMKQIGILPKNRVHKDQIVDDITYAITNDQYAEIKKAAD
ncbi:GNAT family N-acetyltransferase [Mammaliicoccus stepanovicii]|uniref:Acetyltransferase n=1 Tax=Mammaliicoccus stepanovicii TaxID=643214 RepID=A0A239YH51_9STAP|nr:GNAT family N-acetyltransferase [Mammaliicoccus stepanovicii]PNZ74702.1 GNAT family N-acetyltransferase [Mammaliicoccus stepanovicii]GGI40819.1 N-acetyltransferase [Mammaliicoccus stepanovicii]SNV58157.1 acetyltransferase [Mammaliicoccus stepanovicii]